MLKPHTPPYQGAPPMADPDRAEQIIYVDPVEDALAAEEEWLAAARQLTATLLAKSEAELETIAAKHPDALGFALGEAVQLQAWLERQAELARTVVARVQGVLDQVEARSPN
jgi:hypothetical protein